MGRLGSVSGGEWRRWCWDSGMDGIVVGDIMIYMATSPNNAEPDCHRTILTCVHSDDPRLVSRTPFRLWWTHWPPYSVRTHLPFGRLNRTGLDIPLQPLQYSRAALFSNAFCLGG
jgi:hypothetical protein